MPIETQDVVNWALSQTFTNFKSEEQQITKNNHSQLVSEV